MVLQLSKEPSARLLKHVVRCYLRLSDNSRYFFHTFSLLWESLAKIRILFVLLNHFSSIIDEDQKSYVVSLRAREALRQCLPDQLKDTTFAQVLKDDSTTKRWLAQLVKNLQEGQVTDPRGIPLPPQ